MDSYFVVGNLRPPLNESNSQQVYVPDMCRQITTHYQRDIDWHKIRLRRFNLTIDNFASSEDKPENACYDDIFHEPSGKFEPALWEPLSAKAPPPQSLHRKSEIRNLFLRNLLRGVRFVSGVAEVGPCKKGAPILMSLPHFLQADPKFRKDTTGLSPDISKHEFTMDHEPVCSRVSCH